MIESNLEFYKNLSAATAKCSRRRRGCKWRICILVTLYLNDNTPKKAWQKIACWSFLVVLLYSSFSFTLSTCIQPPQRKIDGNQSFLLATHLVKSAKSMPNLQFLCPMQILGWRWNKDNNPEKSYEFCLVNSWLFLANFPRTIIQYY